MLISKILMTASLLGALLLGALCFAAVKSGEMPKEWLAIGALWVFVGGWGLLEVARL